MSSHVDASECHARYHCAELETLYGCDCEEKVPVHSVFADVLLSRATNFIRVGRMPPRLSAML